MHPLSQKITSLQHRLLWRRRAVAACRISATAIAAALVLGLADYLMRFSDPGLRIMSTLALVVAVVWAVYRSWYLPGQQRLVPLVVARRVESRFPQLRDSLASAVEFLRQSENDQTAGSTQLRRLVIAEAHNAIESIPLDDVIERGPLQKAAAAVAVAVVAASICVALDAGAVRTALARLAAPLGVTQWPRQHHLTFRDVPARLAAGQTFEVELVDTGGKFPDDVRIQYGVTHNGGREVTSEPMTRSGDTMIARRENVRQSFAFRATGGDDDTMAWNWVEVKESPRLESLTITVHPPAYTGLPATRAERHLEVLSGTGIEIRATTSKPIRAARILQDHGESVEATVLANAAGTERRAFYVDPKLWTATQSGPYRFELVDENGLAGILGPWNFRVEADSPPSVSWQRPSDDLYVLPRAVVPIELVVKDDLAIRQVVLSYDRNDKSESERAAQPHEPPIELYRGPENPPAFASAVGPNARGDRRVVTYSWDLAPLQLPTGAVLTMQADASDYRPNVGQTIGPRHISLITSDELEARFADRQLQIVRQLERAQTIERKTREDVRQVQIQLRDAGALTGRDRNMLQAAESSQRSVGRMLGDSTEGVRPLIDAISSGIEINRLEASEMRETMSRLTTELKRLSAGPLNIAESELTSAGKTAESILAEKNLDARQIEVESRSLAAAGGGQDDVIAALERLIGELSGKADYRRFAKLIAELREEQIAHGKAARAEIGIETRPLQPSELSRAQRANLNRAAAGESAIAGRFEKIERSIDQLGQQMRENRDPMASTLADAVDLCGQLSIGSGMRQTAADFSENRVGLALDREAKIADWLQQVLNVLRNESERRPQQLVDKLKQAEQQLGALRQQLAGLRQQIAQVENTPNAVNQNQLQQLNQRQQNLRRKIEQLARQLERSQAAEASQSAQKAASGLENRPSAENRKEANGQRPSPSSQVEKSEQHLAEAARQLAERRAQAEDDLALEFVRRFQTELGDMVKRQRRVIKKTDDVEARRQASPNLSADQSKTVSNLADEERQLAQMAKEHSEILFGLGSVRASLEDAERRLAVAGKILDDHETGSPAKSAEQLALARLEAMMQAFAQTANDAAQKPNANQNSNANQAQNAANNGPPQRKPTFELLEVKMLRILQADLNERTREHEKRLTEGASKAAASAALKQEELELAVEQGRLAELVQKMLTRDNKKQEP